MKSRPIYGLVKYVLKLKLSLHGWYTGWKRYTPFVCVGLIILIQQVRRQRQIHNVCLRQWACACFPAGAKGLTGCGEILDLSEMSLPPPQAMWNIWLLIMSLFPIVLSLLHVRIHPSPAELIKELEMMLQLLAIAERLSGNHPPLTFFLSFFTGFWVVLLFSSGFLFFFWHIVVFVPPGLLVSGWELS